MGYILPIQTYQYNEYQRRSAEDKINPYVINKPFKPVLESQYQDVKHHTARRHVMLNKEHNQLLLQKPQGTKVYEELTGKGERFSVSI